VLLTPFIFEVFVNLRYCLFNYEFAKIQVSSFHFIKFMVQFAKVLIKFALIVVLLTIFTHC